MSKGERGLAASGGLRRGGAGRHIEMLEGRQLLSASSFVTRAAKPASTKIVAHSVAIASVEGAGFSSAHVATFVDANGAASGADTATINWGDGSASQAGTIVFDGVGGFIVEGGHTYPVFGNYKVKVTVSNPDGRSASTVSTAKVSDAPLSAIGSTVTATSGTSYDGRVAVFADGDGSSTDSETPPKPVHTATINWGDGHTSPATLITQDSSLFYTVSGKHTYANPGTYTLTTTIKDRGGAKVTSAGGTMTVNAPAPVTTPSLVGSFSGQVSASDGGLLGFIAGLTGKHSFGLNITAQDVGSITAEVIISGTSSGTTTLTGAELSNGNFHYSTSDTSGASITITGHISPDGKTITNGTLKASGSSFLSIGGKWSATRTS